jgi:hypothetical protein
MKDSTIVLLLIGGAALLFWAVSTGLIRTTGGMIPVGAQGQVAGGTILAPQPSSNYSGYLAATTAPGVSTALNSALSGISTGVNHLFAGWFGGSGAAAGPAPQQTASANSPALAAQPAGPVYGPFVDAQTFQGTSSPVGPINDPSVAYGATSGAAFDYAGLANANTYDPGYSLQDASLA